MKLVRIQEMENYILANGTVSIDDLCERFDVSKNTVRRDLNRLTEKGVIEKVYGGVTATEKQLIPFENRHHVYNDEKVRIALHAASFIEDQDFVYIDSGTTTKWMFDHFPEDKFITVLTNNLDVINAVSDKENIELFVLGNHYQAKTRSFVNISSFSLNKYNVDKAFMACTGASISKGLTNADLHEYEVKKSIVQKENELFLLADASKFGQSTMLTYAPLSRVDHIITSAPLDESYKTFFQEENIVLHTV
ncbi:MULTISPECIES: DeoR/GlpR family DNA-binding transcription regulator [Shouchella]|uniref:HTH-type, DeoR family transcriptional regulator n=3 Tax=Bacillaceae TaxID=186817 RepID=A0A060LNA5_9BACI|nr:MULTISPECIES: DeoR/GlpR family DNA-binding transcription regulator [Bacillaceae]RQW22467.1 DeoR/GlpR transcriptional regulator [Bacillus sp. C1-1]AIC92861.1 HTH-type, DeoR family transcriptional regulator [Shouchella lehensis G1]KQL56147.1 DeoR family transcriptional regulator [Alkalicoccobacillus plakortidis]MBG9783332.1 DeoR family transcriptional regulator [Shouchella lehensis]TES49287.1 DeoR/GlpR transcriptional regulator [Shouchella lehensis]